MVFRFLSRDAVAPWFRLCVSVRFWCLVGVSVPSPRGELGAPHIKRLGIALLSDVIESNEIQLSQWVSELQCVEQ